MKKILIIALLALASINSFASHIPGGNLTWTCTGNPNEYVVTMVMFVSCPSTLGTSYNVSVTNTCGLQNPTLALAQVGVMQEVSQICPDDMWNSACATPAGTIPGVRMYTYEATVTLPGPCNTWDFAFDLCCRDANSNTAGGSGNNMYFHSGMNSATAPCDNSPYITAQPIPYVCAGVQQTYCPGAIDPDGDLLTYSLVNPLGAGGTPIAYNAPYSSAGPLQNLVLDPVTGCITFNQPTTGNFVVTYLIEAWDANGNMTGFIYHDFQFEVIINANCQPPVGPAAGLTNVTGAGTLMNPNVIQICEGQSLCFDVVFTDPDVGDTLKLDSSNTNIWSALPGVTMIQTGANPTTFSICWTVPPGQSPNTSFTLGVTDGSCPIENLANYPVQLNVINSTVALQDQTICGGQVANLTAVGGTIFNWTAISGPPIAVGTNFSCNPCSNPVATPTATTSYQVISNLAVGCNNIDTVTVTVVPDFTPTVTQSSASTCLFDPVQLDVTVNPAGPGYTYQWTPSTFLDFDTIANPLATITTPGTYTYYVDIYSPGGCLKSDSITIVISNNIAPTFTMTAADSMLFCGQTTQFTLIPDTLVLAGSIDDFNGPLSANWQSVINGTPNVDCGSMTGNALHFNSAAIPREAITIPQNVSSCTTVDFCLFIGNAGSGGAPCENADANEDVELSYSISGPGGPWILMQMFDSDDWDAAGPYNNTWTCFSIPIPPGAQTATTLFKWDQPTFSACTGCDNWAIDDVSITCPSTTTNYNYSWTPSISLDDDTIQNPIGSPQTTTTYVVTVTDPNGGCSTTDSVTVFVQCGTCYPVVPAVTNVTCKDGSDGSIIVTPNFVFASEVQTLTWTDSISGAVLQVTPNLTVGMTDSLNNLPAGAYTISMQDTSGCIADTTIWITEPDSVSIATITSDDFICIGGSMQISATAIDGNGGPYTYTWTNLNTGIQIPGNGPHTVNPIDTFTCYSVFATDPLGCISSPEQVCITLFDSITATSLIASTSNDSLRICPNASQDIDIVAIGGMGAPYTYTWYQNNVQIGTGTLINVTPTTSSTTYIGVAYDNCSTPADSVIIYIDWHGLVVPSVIRNKPDSCYPFTVQFTSTTTPVSLIASTQWSITNGDGGAGNSVFATFDTPTCHDVTLTITTTDGCIVDTTLVDEVCPHDYPSANFSMEPPITDILNTDIQFTNLSTGGTPPLTYLWNFNSGLNPDTSVVTHPNFTYPNNIPGTYDALLTVTDFNGCQDVISGTVIINGIYIFYAPNSFTPDGDGLNEVFRPYGEGIDFSQYTMKIYDRWGELMYYTVNAERGWDGTYKGKAAPVGTYVWKIVAKEEYGTIIHDNYGHVNLVK